MNKMMIVYTFVIMKIIVDILRNMNEPKEPIESKKEEATALPQDEEQVTLDYKQ